MTVKQLKKLLEKFDDKDIVVLSKDGEGNGYSPLSDYGDEYYIADSTWSGELAYTEKDFKDSWFEKEDETYKEYLKRNKAKRCIVLWPTN